MTANIRGLIREAIAAFKQGRKDEAQKLLTRATELDPHNEEAWLWLSAVVDSLENQQICLENVLAINPQNTRAVQGLERIKRQLGRNQPLPPAPPPGVAAAPPPGPATGAHNTPPFQLDGAGPPPAHADPFAAIASQQPPQPAASAGGFHGSGKHVPQPSDDEYDAWVEGLNLGQAAPPAQEAYVADAFDFDSGPFEQAAPAAVDPFTTGIDEAAAPAYGDYVSPGQEGYSDPGYDPFAPPPPSGYQAAFTEEETYAEDGYGDAYAEGGAAPAYGTFVEEDAFADQAEDVFDPFAGLEVEPELAEDGRQDASDLIRFLDGIPPDIKATYLPGPAAIPRLMRFGMAVVSLGVVVSLIVLVVLLMTPAA